MASNRCECCGAARKRGDTQCPYCGAEYPDAEPVQTRESDDDRGDTAHATYYDPNYSYTASSSYNTTKVTSGRRLILALMALFLGSFGVQYFMLGKIGKGLLMIFISMTAIPAIIGIVQGISWLMMSDAAFDEKYPPNN